MKQSVFNRKSAALTRVEMVVVLSALIILLAILLSMRSSHPDLRREIQDINCINNLKQVGVSFRVWADDSHHGKYPFNVSVTNGGTMELVNGSNAWLIFSAISSELSTPKILICPADTDKIAATNFTTDFNNSKISYFVGLGADETNPQMFLSGDDNFAIRGVPVKSGSLELSTNIPISWTATRHVSHGNIVLADGSVQPATYSELSHLLQQTGIATNHLAIP